MFKYSLSLILPVYNEDENIRNTIKKAYRFLRVEEQILNYEVIVIDDGSRDATADVLCECRDLYPNLKIIKHKRNRGYGAAIMSGFKNSSYPNVFIMDADGQFDVRDLDRLLPYSDQYNIVVGYREKRQDSLYRIILGKTHTFLIFLLFGLKLKDVNCGFKLIKREVLGALGFVCSGPLVYSDILVNAKNKGLKIKEVPVSHYPCRKGKQTGGSLKVIFTAIRELLELWYRVKIKGKKTKKHDRCK